MIPSVEINIVMPKWCRVGRPTLNSVPIELRQDFSQSLSTNLHPTHTHQRRLPFPSWHSLEGEVGQKNSNHECRNALSSSRRAHHHPQAYHKVHLSLPSRHPISNLAN